MLVSGILGIPALLAVLSPSLKRRQGESWQVVGRITEYPIGEVVKAVVEVPRDDWARSLRERGVFVLREAADRVVVYSRSCTDLSCPVTWDPGSHWFFCPCHGGIFSKDGEPKAGPPKIPLYRYRNRQRAGMLEIDVNSLPPMI